MLDGVSFYARGVFIFFATCGINNICQSSLTSVSWSDCDVCLTLPPLQPVVTATTLY